MSILNDLKPFYPEILALMPDEFDSHQFILRLAQKHQSEYITALYTYRENPAPFREVHGQISNSLYDYAEHIGERHSANIFGDTNDNALWRKRK